VNRPRGPGPTLDPDTAARLRQILDPAAGPAPVLRRPEGPPPARIEVGYLLDLAGHDSAPIVEVRERRVQQGAPPGAWEPARVTEKGLSRYSDEADRDILAALVQVTTSTASRQIAFAEAPPSRFALSRAACASLLPRLCRTGRFGPSRADAAAPLTWSDTPWSLRLRVTDASAEAAGSWDVHGVLRSDDAEVLLSETEGFLAGGYAIAQGILARVDDGGASSWLGMLRTHRRVRITPPRRAAFLEELYSLPASPPLDLPGSLALPEVAGAPIPRLRVHPPAAALGEPRAPAGLGDTPKPPAAAAPLFADLSFDYDGVVVPARRPGRVAFDGAHMRLLRRDAEVEAAASARLGSLGAQPIPQRFAQAPPEGAHLVIAAVRLPKMVAALSAEGWKVEAGGRAYRAPRAWSLGIRSGVDWLDLEGSVEFDGFAAPLPAVLEALRRGAATVVLDDGSLGLLPEEWLARHGIVLRLGTTHEGRVRFSRSQAPLLEALAADEPRVRADEDFWRARAPREAPRTGDREEPVPAAFRGELRGYQREGLGWLRRLELSGLGGLLADDMGLGKTVQVLAHLSGRRRERPSLVVAPRSLVFNWKRETARFAPHLRLLDHTGQERRPPGPHFADHDLVLTTYGTLRRDAGALAAIDFDYVVLDEAQAIKNDASETARAARRLRASHRLALSGTPVENHLGELWSLVEFCNPGLLGRAATWKAAVEAGPGPDAVALLGRALQPMLLRRTKAQVAPDLPARLEETWVCELDEPDRALYEALRARFRAEILGTIRHGRGTPPSPRATGERGDGGGFAPARVLEALLRLRQAACHPGLVDPARRGARGAKLDALLPELAALRRSGQKALVFSQFRTLLDLTRPHLEAEGIGCLQLDGQTRDREETVARFQADEAVSVLLVSLKAGGVGLNLTAAEYVFLLDPWWNPAAEAQAIDRAHRLGQTRAVFAYRLIAKDTVEERIAELQQKKRLLAESVIRGDGAPLAGLSLDEIDALLS
jgi:superfamily II DNA or RNA helicase